MTITFKDTEIKDELWKLIAQEDVQIDFITLWAPFYGE